MVSCLEPRVRTAKRFPRFAEIEPKFLLICGQFLLPQGEPGVLSTSGMQSEDQASIQWDSNNKAGPLASDLRGGSLTLSPPVHRVPVESKGQEDRSTATPTPHRSENTHHSAQPGKGCTFFHAASCCDRRRSTFHSILSGSIFLYRAGRTVFRILS